MQFVNEEFDITPADMKFLEFNETGALTTELLALAGTCGIRGTAEFACPDCAATSRLYGPLQRAVKDFHLKWK